MTMDGQIVPAPQVLKFWSDAGPEKWFKKDDAFDEQIRQTFMSTYVAAAAGGLDHWLDDGAASATALIIVLDQFPRNMFRNDARAFAADSKALALAQEILARGLDKDMSMPLRKFIYMPFMHAEDSAAQQRCIDLFTALDDEESARYAKIHADIIARFGRFPHRNKVLGRDTTPEEQAFLDAGGFAG